MMSSPGIVSPTGDGPVFPGMGHQGTSGPDYGVSQN